MRPVANELFLIGFAMAFLDLEVAIAAEASLLDLQARHALSQIVSRKKAAFADYLKILESTPTKYEQCMQQYLIGRSCANFALHEH
ncbi:hypothetical protein V2A60_007757 [Cordyceps javanica]